MVGWKVIWFCTMVIQIDPVDHEVHGVFPVAGSVDRERTLAAEEARLRKPFCGGVTDPGMSRAEVNEMPAVSGESPAPFCDRQQCQPRWWWKVTSSGG